MKKSIIIIVGLLLFYIFGGFSRFNAVTALIDSAKHKYIQVHSGYPGRPNLQQRIAGKLGYEIHFSGCMIKLDQFLGQNLYNKIALYFMHKNLGNDLDEKFKSEFDVASDFLSKYDSIIENDSKIHVVCIDQSKRVETDILEWHSRRLKFQSTFICQKELRPIKIVTFEIDTLDANNLTITSITNGINKQ
jgi:hypothetical protein